MRNTVKKYNFFLQQTSAKKTENNCTTRKHIELSCDSNIPNISIAA